MSSSTPRWSLLILSRYSSKGASSRLRTFQYVPALQAHGADVTIAPFFDDAYLQSLYSSGRRRLPDVARAYGRRVAALVKIRRASVLWIEKELFPFLPGIVESLPARLGAPYVVDYDDATFHTYDASPNLFVRGLLSRKLDLLLRGARAVTAGNAYLETYARAHGAKHVERIPTVVDLTRYHAAPEPKGDEIRIGWIGTPATTKYLESLFAPLREVARTRPIRLVTVGASPLPDFGVPLEQHGWSAETEAALLASVHLGVMPLPDEPWERGKCGYKLIQYMAAGRPIIASPVGVNTEIVTPEVGFPAAAPEDWIKQISRLAADPFLRQIMGMAARRRVEQHYSLQVVAPRICVLLSAIANRQ